MKVFRINKCYNSDHSWLVFYPKKITPANCLHTCVMNSWTWAMNSYIVKTYNLQYDLRLGRGAKNPVFSSGEDYRFAYCYLDVLIRQYKREPKINLFENPGYQYRDVHQRVKQTDPDVIWGSYRAAKLFQKNT